LTLLDTNRPILSLCTPFPLYLPSASDVPDPSPAPPFMNDEISWRSPPLASPGPSTSGRFGEVPDVFLPPPLHSRRLFLETDWCFPFDLVDLPFFPCFSALFFQQTTGRPFFFAQYVQPPFFLPIPTPVRPHPCLGESFAPGESFPFPPPLFSIDFQACRSPIA